MFDETCVNDVNSAAEDYALQLTLNPTVGSTSNLTVDSIYQVCPDIAQMLNDNPPKSCSKYWQQNTTWIVPTGEQPILALHRSRMPADNIQL